MRPAAFRRLVSNATILFWLCQTVVFGQTDTAVDGSLPLVDLQFSGNGDVEGWRVLGLERTASDLLDSGSAILRLQLSFTGRDVGDQVVWERLPSTADNLGAFIGRLSNPEMEIRRTYRRGTNRSTIVHELEFAVADDSWPAGFAATISIEPNLRKHSPSSGSLGSVFYNYSRLFAVAESDGRFELVTEPIQTATAAATVRHVGIVVSSEGSSNGTFTVTPDSGISLRLESPEIRTVQRQTLEAVVLRNSALAADAYRPFLYTGLWWPLQALARLIEEALDFLSRVIGNAGVAVVGLAVLIRVCLLPLGLWSIRQQRRFTALQKKMKPRIDQINRDFKGAEKSEQILKAYKEYHFSPLSGLMGSAALFVQLPILIAFFAVTTESALFRDAAFLWVADLSLPDQTVALPFTILGLGAYLNVLPIMLGIVSVVAALIHARSGASPFSGLFLALVFVVFFYSCAAAIVLYWLMINLTQIVEGLYVSGSAKGLEGAT